MADVVKTHVGRSIVSLLRRPNELYRGMARHPELCCLMLAFLITLIVKYGCSFKAKPLIVPPKQPQYMFPPSSFVMDSPRGSLVPVIQLLHQEEFVFVMYYAPWCSKSQASRREFVKAATFFRGKVKFAAVNCWWPEGECRKRYKFLIFPVFMAYHTKLDGYRYFGLPRAEHMIKFVEGLLHPLVIIYSKQEVLELLARHDTVILGFFNLTSQDQVRTYRQFYYASMRILEKDPFQPVKFAVVTEADVAKLFRLSDYEDIIMLRLTNTSLVYPFGKNITSFNLLRWASQYKCSGIVTRLSPEGLKSQALSSELNKGPAFIMFHVENPLFNTEYGLRVLKDVALRYRGCMIDPAFQDVHSVWPAMTARDVENHQGLMEVCELLRQSQALSRRALPCCISALVHSIDADRKVCNVCQTTVNQCRLPSHHLSSALNDSKSLPLSCRNVIVNYSWSEKLSVCCQNRNESELQQAKNMSHDELHRVAAMEKKVYDYFKGSKSADSLSRRSTDRYIRQHLENLPRRLCDRLSVEKLQGIKSSWPSESEFEADTASYKERIQEFSHIGCTSNKSLNFYAIDSENHWMFSDALGVQSSSSHHGPSVVLFDKANEVHYIMKDSLTLNNTMSFILDFEAGRLRRYRQSHNFQQSGCDEPSTVCVRELDSSTFLHAVHEDDKDVVVLIYAHWCGFCQTLSHTFLSLAQYFAPSRHITFVRINGATNDLPWEYTFDSYPTIVFFPARKKADSIVFPANKEITLTSLVRFVLRHATHDTTLHLAADVCSKSCIQQNLKRSTEYLQSLRRKQARLQQKLHEVSGSSAEEKDSNTDSPQVSYYTTVSAEYLSQRLRETQTKMDYVKKLIDYLSLHEGSAINKQELVDLFTPGKISSGA